MVFFFYEWLVNPVGKSGGLVVWWIEKVKVDILFSSPNIIHSRIDSGDLASLAYISFVYGPPDEGN